jgi:hypothetical protein
MVRSTSRWWYTLFCVVAVVGAANAAPTLQQRVTSRTGKVRRPIVNMTKTQQDGIFSVELTPVPGGAAFSGQNMDMGKVSYGSSAAGGVQIDRTSTSFTVRTSFGILVRDSSRNSAFASISGYVPGGSDRMVCRLDGKQLTSIPAVVAPHAVVGSVSRHTLAIEIPTSLTEREARAAVVVQFIVVPN